VALPRGSDRSSDRSNTALPARAEVDPAADPAEDSAWGPPPREDAADAAPAVPTPRSAEERSAEERSPEERSAGKRSAGKPRRTATGDHLTPGLADAGPSHARATRRADAPEGAPARPHGRTTRSAERGPRKPARTPGRTRTVDGDFGPPESADIGEPLHRPAARASDPPELPPAADPGAADATMAAWTRPRAADRRDAVPARRAVSRRRPGWPMSNEPATSTEPAASPEAPFGPGTSGRRGDPGAAPR
jgi:hypothetical protein